jgi:hypothetical protein
VRDPALRAVTSRRLLTGALVLAGCRGAEVQAPSATSVEAAPAVSFEGCDGYPEGGITVGSTTELNAALSSARRGDVIRLAPNTVFAGTKRVTDRSSVAAARPSGPATFGLMA